MVSPLIRAVRRNDVPAVKRLWHELYAHRKASERLHILTQMAEAFMNAHGYGADNKPTDVLAQFLLDILPRDASCKLKHQVQVFQVLRWWNIAILPAAKEVIDAHMGAAPLEDRDDLVRDIFLSIHEINAQLLVLGQVPTNVLSDAIRYPFCGKVFTEDPYTPLSQVAPCVKEA